VAIEDCVEGGGWDADEDCWVDVVALTVEACETWEEEDGLVEVVGTKEERFVATARAERRAVMVVNIRFCSTAPILGAWYMFSPTI